MHMQIIWSFWQCHNQNQWPWKHRCRHHFHPFISYLKWARAKKWNFGNGRPNLHITQNAQGCQGGIIQILDQHPW